MKVVILVQAYTRGITVAIFVEAKVTYRQLSSVYLLNTEQTAAAF